MTGRNLSPHSQGSWAGQHAEAVTSARNSHGSSAACQAELLDSPMAASFIRSVNVGQNESDTKEFHKNLNFFISLFQRSLILKMGPPNGESIPLRSAAPMGQLPDVSHLGTGKAVDGAVGLSTPVAADLVTHPCGTSPQQSSMELQSSIPTAKVRRKIGTAKLVKKLKVGKILKITKKGV